MGTLLAGFLGALMLSLLIGLVYLIRTAIVWRRKKTSEKIPVDPEDPFVPSSRSSSGDDLAIPQERRNTATSTSLSTTRSFLSSYSRSESIPIPSREASSSLPIYAEIPIVVKPLSLPRVVELVGSVRPMSQQEKQESLRLKIRQIQDSLKALTYSKLRTNLLIGVNSSGKRIGGYCVHPVERWASMYTLKVQDLPWNIEDEEDELEIATKNFLFALILWKDEIKRARSIRLYTGHRQSISPCNRDEDARKTSALLRHYQECEKVVVVNEDEITAPQSFPSCSGGCSGDSWHCNYPVDLDSQDIENLEADEDFLKFVRFVQPAVDLSHWRIKACEKFLTNVYNIEEANVKKTHCQIKWNKSECRPWFDTTRAYGEFLEKVTSELRGFVRPCPTCGFSDA